jgi:CRISPR-associated protein Cmr6
MSIAAVPTYLGNNFKDASPGMRFGMYLTLWEGTAWSKTKDKPLDGAKRLGDNDKKTMQALIARQERCFDAVALSENTLRLEAQSIAPFTTGLGNEHPLENGFAFLNPYGLPYLPGSGVKGVLRQAARELASGDWGETRGWDEELPHPKSLSQRERDFPLSPANRMGGEGLSVVDILFGLEPKNGDTEQLRGALTFWDVIPQIKGDSLMVEIMTPHQKHYYQDGQSPHDSGQPTPISFLTVPPGSGFAFHVQCDLAHLKRISPELATDGQWKKLIEAAFEHAFQWLGFGAKTAVGFGAMKEDDNVRKAREEAAAKQAEEERRASLSEAERGIEALRNQIAASNKGRGKGDGLFNAVRETVREAAGWTPAEREALKTAAGQALEHLGLKKDDIKKELRPLSDASA